MDQQFAAMNVLGNAILWAIGFAGGLILGFTVPVIGDVLAVILAGGLVIFLQTKLLEGILSAWDWIKYTVIGLVLSTGLSFLIIMLANRTFFDLPSAHIIGFPLLILGIVLSQSYYLRSQGYVAGSWIIYSFTGFLVAFGVIFILAGLIDLELGQLAVREQDFVAALSWALMGLIFGLGYGISTGFGIANLQSQSKAQ